MSCYANRHILHAMNTTLYVIILSNVTSSVIIYIFFFQAEDGIRYWSVTGVQTFVFFFSSRRRHTRLVSDWSSDVCSSDLGPRRGRVEAVPRQASSRGKHLPHLGGDAHRRDPLRRLRRGRPAPLGDPRSEERRVGKEGRSRGAPYH